MSTDDLIEILKAKVNEIKNTDIDKVNLIELRNLIFEIDITKSVLTQLYISNVWAYGER